MIRYVLDTDILTLWREDHPQVLSRIQAQAAGSVGVSVISVQEQLSGWYGLLTRVRRRDQVAFAYRGLAETVSFLAGVPILPFTEPAILRFEHLLTLKLNVGRMDLRIAAIALENNAAVVTRNQRDFGRVPGLVTEDWSV